MPPSGNNACYKKRAPSLGRGSATRASHKAGFVNPIDLAKLAEMCERTINIDNADSQLLLLVAKGERGERIVISGTGNPVVERRSTRKNKKQSNQLADPLLCVDEYSHEGSVGPTADKDIDRTVYVHLDDALATIALLALIDESHRTSFQATCPVELLATTTGRPVGQYDGPGIPLMQ